MVRVAALALLRVGAAIRRRLSVPPSLYEICGAAAVVYGVFLLHPPSAFIVGGLAAVALAQGLEV